ncbi:hypothetical protein K402DRAFT_33564 [Aulographum hederae CBS 113979]|uniref:ABM domain-containing protein n=1 Tax=Aulographum hederae CBS 113979 TaxID=1176131 RepID=A0A6G1H558_9PEZI|nr:hypothetical protein K402DRAFT_33564 [Aulographum hederae CBS 113979]
MEEASEIALLPLADGVDLSDPKSDGAKILADSLTTISKQKGFRKAYHGTQLEHPDLLVLVVVWKNITSHTDFTNTPQYQPFVKNIEKILRAPAFLHHAHFRVPFEEAAKAPVVEMLTCYFPADINYPDQEEFEKVSDELFEAAKTHSEGYVGFAGGWVAEDLKHESLIEEIGGKGKAYVAAVGWKSVDAHKEFRETDAFKKKIGPMREAAEGMQMYHVSFTPKEKAE